MYNSSYYSIFLCMSNSLIYLDGINSINISKSTNYDQQLLMGGVIGPNTINQPNQISIKINKSFVEYDPIYTLTGDKKIDFLHFYDGVRFLTAKDLYLNDFQASFSIGDLPKMSFSLLSYNGFLRENVNVNTGSALKFEKLIPKLNSIYIDSDNRIVTENIKNNINIYSIDYSASINRRPTYSIGNYEEIDVLQTFPVKVSSSISAKQKITGMDHLVNPFSVKDIQFLYYDFNINISGSQNNIIKFPMQKTNFVSSEINSNSNTYLDIKYNFQGILGGYYG